MPSLAPAIGYNSTVATASLACFTPSGPASSVFEVSGVLCAGGRHGANRSEPSLQCSAMAVFPPVVDLGATCSDAGALVVTEPFAISLPPASVSL
ncbi:hypothetical protein SUGI_0613470 [Cryptomeria japonica]|nr:hypothetical protein SUGI_0613470 [Cryptomeria japonica]